jgi:hypothetical protein
MNRSITHRSIICRVALGALFIHGLLLAVACEPVSGPVEVEALIPDAEAPYGYRLETVTLEQIEDLMQGVGRDFDVRSGTSTDLAGTYVASAAGPEAVQEAARGGGGQPAAPSLSFDGARWVGNDWDSILYLTTLHNFENAFRYYRDVVGDTSGATANKGVVGLGHRNIVSQYLPLEVPFGIALHDNAGYNTINDSWVLVPHVLAPVVPISASQGVIGHEFGHRVFQYNVVFESGLADLPRLEESQQQAFVFAGLNEGLADILAVGMVQDARFMMRDFSAEPMGRIGKQRDLEGEFATSVTFGSLLDGEHEALCGDALPPTYVSTDAPPKDFNFYCVGTLAASVLWETAERDMAVLREVINPAVVESMRGLGARLLAANTGKVEDDDLTFDVSMHLDAMAEALPEGPTRERYCTLALDRFAAALDDVDVPFCR